MQPRDSIDYGCGFVSGTPSRPPVSTSDNAINFHNATVYPKFIPCRIQKEMAQRPDQES
jgi:hypothetical protein